MHQLLERLWKFRHRTPEYIDKMLHDLPAALTVDRTAYILKHCQGKSVLDIGASGNLQQDIQGVCREYWGVDHPSNNQGRVRPGVFYADLDERPDGFPNRDVDIVVCGEVLEHLSNPGQFLKALRAEYHKTPMIVSVPNAFSQVARNWAAQGVENVNSDHIAWHTPKTLGNLLVRAGFVVREWSCYNGTSPFAEGWIALCS